MRRVVLWVLPLVAACAVPAPPGPPTSVRTVAVLPPSNRTGDGLLVSGTSLLEKYAFRTDRVTVPDVLGAQLRRELARRGLGVVPGDAVDAATGGRAPGSPEAAADVARHARLADPVLFVAIDRWEPDAPTHPAFVVVALDAALVDPTSGAVLWRTHRNASPVPTPGSVTLAVAYETAAEKVAAELLDGWPAREPPA